MKDGSGEEGKDLNICTPSQTLAAGSPPCPDSLWEAWLQQGDRDFQILPSLCGYRKGSDPPGAAGPEGAAAHVALVGQGVTVLRMSLLCAHLDACALQAGGSLAAADLLATGPPLTQQLTPKLIFWRGKKECGVRTQSQPSTLSAAPARGRNAVFIPWVLSLLAVQILRVSMPQAGPQGAVPRPKAQNTKNFHLQPTPNIATLLSSVLSWKAHC